MLVVGNTFATSIEQDVSGTWAYEAPTAPYEYSKGKLVFTEKDGNLEGKIKIGDKEIAMRNIKVEGDNVSFGSYIQGEYVSIKLTLAKNAFTGTANSSEGALKLSGKKEK